MHIAAILGLGTMTSAYAIPSRNTISNITLSDIYIVLKVWAIQVFYVVKLCKTN